MQNNVITEELEELCNSFSIPIELIKELIEAEKWNIWNKWTSHIAILESIIKKYTK